jgi:hypothetical protein
VPWLLGRGRPFKNIPHNFYIKRAHIKPMMKSLLRKIMRLVKKEEERHVPTMDEIQEENKHLLQEEKRLSKLLKPSKAKKTTKKRRAKGKKRKK